MEPVPNSATFGKREDILRGIEQVVSEAEKSFLDRYGIGFNPNEEEDYVRMAPLCEGPFPPQAGASNIGVVFLRHFIMRDPLLLPFGEQKQNLLDGLVGWLNYNPPPREYKLRIQALEQLTPDDWAKISISHLEAISKLATAVSLTQSLPLLWKDPERHEDCCRASSFCAYLREGAGYLVDEEFRSAVETEKSAYDVAQRMIAFWRTCVHIYSAPGAASYT